MSLIAQIPINPHGSRVRYPVKRFSAPFVAGAYDFDQVGNTDLLLYSLSPSSVYCMERINFFANVSERGRIGSGVWARKHGCVPGFH